MSNAPVGNTLNSTSIGVNPNWTKAYQVSWNTPCPDRQHKIHIPGVGSLIIEESWGQNKFDVSEYDSTTKKLEKQFTMMLDFDGNWKFDKFPYTGWSLRQKPLVEPNPQLVSDIGAEILLHSPFRQRLITWQKATLRRLDKKIPQLRADLGKELREAEARQASLQALQI